jgi:hypothetical protein
MPRSPIRDADSTTSGALWMVFTIHDPETLELILKGINTSRFE